MLHSILPWGGLIISTSFWTIDRCPLKRIFLRNCIGGIPSAKIKGYFLIILYNHVQITYRE
nr:MAG TPA: hypothetical protein [Caudoviricetes sp.]